MNLKMTGKTINW